MLNARQKKAQNKIKKIKEKNKKVMKEIKTKMEELSRVLLPRMRFSSRHNIILRVAVNVAVLNTPPHIDQEDLDLGFRPTQGHKRFV